MNSFHNILGLAFLVMVIGLFIFYFFVVAPALLAVFVLIVLLLWAYGAFVDFLFNLASRIKRFRAR